MRIGLTTAIATAIAIGVLVANGGGSCSFPSCFPDETNTGVPAGTSLTAYTGADPITVDGTIVDGKTITNCPLDIQAINVTIRNSEFTCDGGIAIYIDDQAMYTETSNATVFAVTIEDTDINCNDDADSTAAGGVAEADYHLIRVHIVDCENGLDANQNILVEDSYIHQLDGEGVDPHEDGIQTGCGHWDPDDTGPECPGNAGYTLGPRNVTIRHNTIFGMTGPTDSGFGTSAIITHPEANRNILIENNLLAGGGTTVYCTRPGSGTNVRVINNAFSTRFSVNYGFVDMSDDCNDEADASGNITFETGLPLTLF